MILLLAFTLGGFGGVLLTSVCVVAARADARADEAENKVIVESGILPKLIEQALQDKPSTDWRKELEAL